MALQFQYIFTGVTVRGGKENRQDLVNGVAVLIFDGYQLCDSRRELPAREFLRKIQ